MWFVFFFQFTICSSVTSDALITVQIFFQLLLGPNQNWITLSYHDEQEKPFKITVRLGVGNPYLKEKVPNVRLNLKAKPWLASPLHISTHLCPIAGKSSSSLGVSVTCWSYWELTKDSKLFSKLAVFRLQLKARLITYLMMFLMFSAKQSVFEFVYE